MRFFLALFFIATAYAQFTSSTQLVVETVSVKDKSGKPVEGLTAKDFVLTEDGVAQTIGDVNVRSHTFRFVTPAEGERLKIPNACNVCHADRPPSWATEALRSWSERSAWRTGE